MSDYRDEDPVQEDALEYRHNCPLNRASNAVAKRKASERLAGREKTVANRLCHPEFQSIECSFRSRK